MRFLIDGVPGAGLEAYDRVVHLFDGNDDEMVAAARERWKEAKAAGFTLAYWQQDEAGKWMKRG